MLVYITKCINGLNVVIHVLTLIFTRINMILLKVLTKIIPATLKSDEHIKNLIDI